MPGFISNVKAALCNREVAWIAAALFAFIVVALIAMVRLAIDYQHAVNALV